MKEFKIDLVYLWCDGNDENFAQQKQERLLQRGSSLEGKQDCRFVQIDELKYSLRSVAMYIPWIHHIFIVTNNQVPRWLRTHEKVTIVDHSEILPETARPCFNSEALECCLHKIPNLAEHFLYANDDMFVGRKLKPSFFFDRDGRPIARFKKLTPVNNLHWANMLAAHDLITKRYGISYRDYVSDHNIDAYSKTMLVECEQEFSELMDFTIHQPFRCENSLQRLLFHLYGLIKGQAIMKDVSFTLIERILKKLRLARVNSLMLSNQSNLKAVNYCRPALFCLNDGETSTDEDRAMARIFLERTFPCKSPYEKNA